jgi:hypothetical protein
MTAAKISDTMRRKSDPGDRKAFHHAVRDEFSFHNEERVCKLRIRSHCERSEAIFVRKRDCFVAYGSSQ